MEGRGCAGYIDPWAVQLGNLTISQPPNVQPDQIPENGVNASGKFNLTTMVFSVPSGSYPFTIYPNSWLGLAINDTSPAIGNLRGSSGIVTVTNSSVIIDTITGYPCM